MREELWGRLLSWFHPEQKQQILRVVFQKRILPTSGRRLSLSRSLSRALSLSLSLSRSLCMSIYGFISYYLCHINKKKKIMTELKKKVNFSAAEGNRLKGRKIIFFLF